MSPRHLANLGATVGHGPWQGALVLQYTGSRYLDKRNRALADAYTTVRAGLGFRADWGEVRVDGENLTNEREPVSESELGDAQYYLLPARAIRVSYTRSF